MHRAESQMDGAAGLVVESHLPVSTTVDSKRHLYFPCVSLSLIFSCFVRCRIFSLFFSMHIDAFVVQPQTGRSMVGSSLAYSPLMMPDDVRNARCLFVWIDKLDCHQACSLGRIVDTLSIYRSTHLYLSF